MAFSSRAKRPSPFAAMAAAKKSEEPPDAAFAGDWADEEGDPIIIKDSKIIGPDGTELVLSIQSSTNCSFEMSGETFTGILNAAGKLVWSDGAVWTRKADADAARRQAEEEDKKRKEEEEKAEKIRQAEALRAKLRAEREEAAAKAKAERERIAAEAKAEKERAQAEAQQKAEEEIQQNTDEEATTQAESERQEETPSQADAPEDPAFAEAKAKAQSGADRAKQAYEAEKARKAAALERARAAKEAVKPAEEKPADPVVAEAKAKAQAGMDKAKQAYEAEKARRAAALERARLAKEGKAPDEKPADPAVAEAKAKAQAGMDKARQAYEAERARRAAALERARTAKEANAKVSQEAQDSSSKDDDDDDDDDDDAQDPAVAEAKAKAQAGLNKAREAYEAEKARKAAALERARAERHEAEESKDANESSRTNEAVEQKSTLEDENTPTQPADKPEQAEAKAKAQGGMDKARQAYEAEKARKAAALERVRAAKEAHASEENAQDPTVAEAKAKAQAGMDKARQAYEAEKARKAAALERARAAKEAQSKDEKPTEAAVAEAKAKAQAGLDKAKQAYEAEKARKAAALERARAAKEAKEQTKEDEPTPQTPQVAEAKAKAQAGMDKARQAYEAEKARKAAALERAKAAKEAAAKENAAAEPSAGTTDTSGRESRPSAFEAAMSKTKAEPTKRPSAFEAAAAKAKSGAEKRPSVFEKAMSNAKSPPPKASATIRPAEEDGSDSDSVISRVSDPSYLKYADEIDGVRDDAMDDEPEVIETAPEMMEIPVEPDIVVRLKGLASRPELNGEVGVTVDFDKGKQRWRVRMLVPIEGIDEDALLNLKEENLQPMTQEEYDAWEKDAQNKAKIMEAEIKRQEEEVKRQEAAAFEALSTSKICGSSMHNISRLGKVEGKIVQEPGETGNQFDLNLGDDPDSQTPSEKMTAFLARRGVCLVEANAPPDLIMAAAEEAKKLWDGGHFSDPMQDMGASEMEEALWKQVLYQDEKKGHWIGGEPDPTKNMEALRVLSENMSEVGRDLSQVLADKLGILYTASWDGMLSCYCGNRQYNFHLDNPYNPKDPDTIPDNGLRLTMAYYINPHWDPETKYNGGGLDLFLTDPKGPPATSMEARRADRLRVAPHADTLVLLLSQRIAHQVIQTTGGEHEEPWFCIWLWFFEEEAMGTFSVNSYKRLIRKGLVQDDGMLEGAGSDQPGQNLPHAGVEDEPEECD